MVKLIISKPGLFLSIPGINPFRTPVEIDITKININIVISELKKNGIQNYKIISGEEKIKKPNITDTSTSNNLVIEHTEVLDKIDEIHEKITKKIESILSDFLNSHNQKIIIEKEVEQKSKKVTEIIEDDFIPTINLGKMKSSSNIKK